MSIYEKYQGKKIDVNYETGYHFAIEYLDETTLKWHALSKTAEGGKEEETVTYSYYEIGDDMYNVNWIEDTGIVVSQIADFKNGIVYAFMTWEDETAPGKRAQLLHKGTLSVSD